MSDAPVKRTTLVALQNRRSEAESSVKHGNGSVWHFSSFEMLAVLDAFAAERARADQAEHRVIAAANLLPRNPYETHDIGAAYPADLVDEAFEILTAEP